MKRENLMNNPIWVITLVLIVVSFTFGCLESKYGNERLGFDIFCFFLICIIPLWMIAKALTNDK